MWSGINPIPYTGVEPVNCPLLTTVLSMYRKRNNAIGGANPVVRVERTVVGGVAYLVTAHRVLEVKSNGMNDIVLCP